MELVLPTLSTQTSAALLNGGCFCIAPDLLRLESEIGLRSGDLAFALIGRPHLFADVPVFLAKSAFKSMMASIEAIEAVSRLPAYRDAALGRWPHWAARDHGPAGVFMGYDFHVVDDRPELIEINTNAGGAALNALLLQAQRGCCFAVERQIDGLRENQFDTRVVEMFAEEWARQGRSGALRTIAIVDDDPRAQFLHPEFLLIQTLLNGAGFRALIVDAVDLAFSGNRLHAHGVEIDLVYNRLVDFMLAELRHGALREAYESGAVVVTPNPHVYAVLADKRNLVLLSDPSWLASIGLTQNRISALSTIPKTVEVTAENADELWRSRREWFFKPVSGHGSKGVYRGDKVTRSRWAEVVASDYVAQAYAEPGERTVHVDGTPTPRKADVRLYTYGGRLLLAAARLYQGQTTNFRTEGGGFASVFLV